MHVEALNSIVNWASFRMMFVYSMSACYLIYYKLLFPPYLDLSDFFPPNLAIIRKIGFFSLPNAFYCGIFSCVRVSKTYCTDLLLLLLR